MPVVSGFVCHVGFVLYCVVLCVLTHYMCLYILMSCCAGDRACLLSPPGRRLQVYVPLSHPPHSSHVSHRTSCITHAHFFVSPPIPRDVSSLLNSTETPWPRPFTGEPSGGSSSSATSFLAPRRTSLGCRLCFFCAILSFSAYMARLVLLCQCARVFL